MEISIAKYQSIAISIAKYESIAISIVNIKIFQYLLQNK